MIVDVFLNAIRNVIYGDTITMPSHFGIGTGTTPAAGGDTTLETEVYPDGVNRAPISFKTKSINKTTQFYLNVAAGEANGNALTEFGLPNAATGGTLMNHVVHGAIYKTGDFELKYQQGVKLSDV